MGQAQVVPEYLPMWSSEIEKDPDRWLRRRPADGWVGDGARVIKVLDGEYNLKWDGSYDFFKYGPGLPGQPAVNGGRMLGQVRLNQDINQRKSRAMLGKARLRPQLGANLIMCQQGDWKFYYYANAPVPTSGAGKCALAWIQAGSGPKPIPCIPPECLVQESAVQQPEPEPPAPPPPAPEPPAPEPSTPEATAPAAPEPAPAAPAEGGVPPVPISGFPMTPYPMPVSNRSAPEPLPMTQPYQSAAPIPEGIPPGVEPNRIQATVPGRPVKYPCPSAGSFIQNPSGYPVSPTGQSIDSATQSWPEGAKAAVREIVSRYGLPQEITATRLSWFHNGPWNETTVYRDGIPHYWPTAHTDWIEQTVALKVDPDKYDAIANFDGSVYPDRTAGTITVRCDHEAYNFLAVNLAHDIATGQVDPDEARDLYIEARKMYEEGNPHPYTQGFMFDIESDQADPDRPAF